jgi:hypothetical protein
LPNYYDGSIIALKKDVEEIYTGFLRGFDDERA